LLDRAENFRKNSKTNLFNTLSQTGIYLLNLLIIGTGLPVDLRTEEKQSTATASDSEQLHYSAWSQESRVYSGCRPAKATP